MENAKGLSCVLYGYRVTIVQFTYVDIMKILTPLSIVIMLVFSVATSAAQTAVNSDSALEVKVPGNIVMGLSTQHMDFASIEDSPVEVALDRTSLKMVLGQYESMGHKLVPGMSIERMGFRFKDHGSAPANTELYTVKFPLLMIKKLSESWTRIVNVNPSIHSDFKAKDNDAFSLMGLAIWKYNAGDGHSWTMGAGANRLFGEYQPIPMLAYSYRPHPQTHFVLGFPISKIEHRFNQDWSLFSKLAPEGGNWSYTNPQDSRVNLSYKSWIGTLGLRKNLKGKFWASLEIGQSFARKLNVDNSASENAFDIDNTELVLLSIGIHP